jgi:hypothetical protein
MALCAALVGSWVFACSCAPPPEPKKALEQAKAVFLGEVTKIEEDGQNRTVTVKVERWWKGGDTAEVTVSTAKDGAACGYGFQKGMKYLVYATGGEKDKPLRASLCSRTRPSEAAEKAGDFKELGEGAAPKK